MAGVGVPGGGFPSAGGAVGSVPPGASKLSNHVGIRGDPGLAPPKGLDVPNLARSLRLADTSRGRGETRVL